METLTDEEEYVMESELSKVMFVDLEHVKEEWNEYFDAQPLPLDQCSNLIPTDPSQQVSMWQFLVPFILFYSNKVVNC